MEKLEGIQGFQAWVLDLTEALGTNVGPVSCWRGTPWQQLSHATTTLLSAPPSAVHSARCSETQKTKDSGAVTDSTDIIELLLYSRQYSRVRSAISALVGRQKQ